MQPHVFIRVLMIKNLNAIMKSMEKIFQNTKSLLLNLLIVLFPFFFLPVTQEYFITNKLYFLGFVVLLLSILALIQPLLTKKFIWNKKPLDLPIFLFVLTIIASLVFSSPNKIQAMTNLNLGAVMIILFAIFYFFLSRSKIVLLHSNLFQLITAVLSLITVIFYFNPFARISLPLALQFLKNPTFNTLGNQFDLAVFLGFLAVFNFINLKNAEKHRLPVNYLLLVFNLLALFLTTYQLTSVYLNKTQPITILFPPFRLSWFVALEVLKNFKSALFGVGIDNFSSIFTKVKDFSYNQSPLWQVNSFNVARNSFFHIITEAGVFGLFTFIFVIYTSFKQLASTNVRKFQNISLFTYLLICLFLFPPSLTIFFLLFMTLGLLQTGEDRRIEIDDENLSVLYGFTFFIFSVLIIAGGYFLGRSYLAELYFKKAINGLASNQIKIVYNNIRQARILNPYEEKYILSFSQANMIIANNIANKEKEKITENDRQTITQAVQAAISEAKILISLHPNRAQYYENLANTYKNIITLAQGADVWTISSYQRAIILDPSNPVYRLQLGGTYYLLGKYAESVSFFQQAVSLKPDWPNGYYNLAWSYYQTQQYDKATNAMENVLKLIDKKTSPKDWEKVNAELENFKNKLATVDEKTTDTNQLSLPQKPITNLDPKLDLPPEASPEAK